MKFIPNAPLKNSMLKEIGSHDINEFFADIPQKIRIQHLNLPAGLSQQHTEETLRKIAQKNLSFFNLWLSSSNVK